MLFQGQFSLLQNKGIALVFFLLISFPGFSQTLRTDSTRVTDTVTVITRPHSPTKAAIFSAIVPGAGQVYNRKYWKVPIVYAGLGGFGYLLVQNQQLFAKYRDVLILRADSTFTGVDPYAHLSDDQVYSYRETVRRNRDLCFIGMFAIYVLNIVDASVDAHLFTFDVSEDLSLNVVPYQPLIDGRLKGQGLTLTLKF